MLSSKIENVRAVLGDLAGEVGQEQWRRISDCRRVLAGAQDMAEELENRLIPAAAPQPMTSSRASRPVRA